MQSSEHIRDVFSKLAKLMDEHPDLPIEILVDADICALAWDTSHWYRAALQPPRIAIVEDGDDERRTAMHGLEDEISSDIGRHKAIVLCIESERWASDQV